MCSEKADLRTFSSRFDMKISRNIKPGADLFSLFIENFIILMWFIFITSLRWDEDLCHFL